MSSKQREKGVIFKSVCFCNIDFSSACILTSKISQGSKVRAHISIIKQTHLTQCQPLLGRRYFLRAREIRFRAVAYKMFLLGPLSNDKSHLHGLSPSHFPTLLKGKI